MLTPWLRLRALGRDGPRVLAVTLIASAVIAALIGIGIGIVTLMRNSGESVPLLMEKMAQIIEDARAILPASLQAYVPEDVETICSARSPSGCARTPARCNSRGAASAARWCTCSWA